MPVPQSFQLVWSSNIVMVCNDAVVSGHRQKDTLTLNDLKNNYKENTCGSHMKEL